MRELPQFVQPVQNGHLGQLAHPQDVPLAYVADGPRALSPCGRRIVEQIGGELRIAGGAMLVPAIAVAAVAALDRAIWVVVRDGVGLALCRFDNSGNRVSEPTPLDGLAGDVEIRAALRGARLAMIAGRDQAVLVRECDRQIESEPFGICGRDRPVLIAPRGVFVRRGRELVLRGGTVPSVLSLPGDLVAAHVVGGQAVLDGAAALIEFAQRGEHQIVVYDLRGGGVLWRRVRLGEAQVMAIAEGRGLVVIGRGANVALFDVRAGACVYEQVLPAPLGRVLIDADGQQVIIVDETGRITRLDRRAGYGHSSIAPPAQQPEPIAQPEPQSIAHPEPQSIAHPEPQSIAHPEPHAHPEPQSIAYLEPQPIAHPEPQPIAHPEPQPPEPQPIAQPECQPITRGAEPNDACLAAPPPLMMDRSPSPSLSSDELASYLTDVRALVVALCRTARSPAARAHERAAIVRFARWDRRGAPHVELARELGLRPIASVVLQLAAAPRLFGELAPIYTAIARDAVRPLVDEHLIAQILDADASARTAIACELDDNAPLRRWSAIEIGAGARPFAALTVHPVVLRRLAGASYRSGSHADASSAACEPRSLMALRTPRGALAGLIRDLAAQPVGRPVRVSLSGRTGSGRRTIAAALAQLGGRGLGSINVPLLNADSETVAQSVRQELVDTALRGLVPCLTIDGLGDEPGMRDRVHAVLDVFPGPLILRMPPGVPPPLSPGYIALDLPPMSELERAAAWHDALIAHGLSADPAARIAARFAVEPGTIVRVLRGVRIAVPAGAGQVETTVAAALRQHRAGRLGAVASQVTRLAGWDDLVLSDDLLATLRELVGRVRCRSTVLERWGMERVAPGGGAITALFQGGPGTGKTLAAGAIARELGFELWRVDLSRVMSKWIGETEKNLGALFDAAEQGEIILLFDEADSLFARRTEVRSSHDRHANVEVNYLLQRLDSFTGLAILTTNFGAAIDPAFRRRLSLHVQFPFPDEDERVRLWRAHLPPTVPIAGPLDFAALAHKYQMSGGYIRNAALRAAYLAAAEGTALSAVHLNHAIEAEYRDHGKLGRGGALE